MLIAILIVSLLVLGVLIALLIGELKKSREGEKLRRDLQAETEERFRRMEDSLQDSLQDALRNQRQELTQTFSEYGRLISEGQQKGFEQQSRGQQDFRQGLEVRMAALEKSSAQQLLDLRTTMEQRLATFETSSAQQLSDIRTAMEQRLATFEKTSVQQLSDIRTTMEQRIAAMQQDNNRRLTEMQQVVDEKLQKTLESRLTQSFEAVQKQLEAVYKGLGEMQAVAAGVTDLKKVLSNVKTRGILGEIQLGAILEEILSPEQYDRNVATKKGSRDVVEYAIKLPGSGDAPVYLPVDAKFPGDTYAALADAYDSGNADAVNAAANALTARLKQEAKDIASKYIDPPYTTDFAILFLPFEGLYAEAVNRGMVEELQRKYKVNLAGPSTMAALLNSLQMGFKTLAIQKRSSEVWNILRGVKTEFDAFAKVLDDSQRHLRQANEDLDKLIGVRTRKIQSKLSGVESLDPLPQPEGEVSKQE